MIISKYSLELSLALGLLMAAILSYIFIDLPVAQWVQANILGELKLFLKYFTNIGLGIWWVALAIAMIIIGKYYSRCVYYVQMGWFIIISLAMGGVVTHILKNFIGRPRPKLYFREGIYDFEPFAFASKMNSLPSGHSQTIWTVAVVLLILFPKSWKFVIPTALIISLSRVAVNAHYVSDVFAGSFVAIMVTTVVHHYLHNNRSWFINKHNSMV
jgi:membrane-associated phospholipid phosphatase